VCHGENSTFLLHYFMQIANVVLCRHHRCALYLQTVRVFPVDAQCNVSAAHNQNVQSSVPRLLLTSLRRSGPLYQIYPNRLRNVECVGRIWICIIGGMVLTADGTSWHRKSCASATLSTTSCMCPRELSEPQHGLWTLKFSVL